MAFGVNIRSPWKPKSKSKPTLGNFTGMGGGNYAGQVGYKSEGEKWGEQNVPGWGTMTGNQQAWYLKDMYNSAYQQGQMPKLGTLSAPGSGYRGGGGGGGGGGPTGLDQSTLDWLFGQLGAGRPQGLAYRALDLPDPSKYYGAFNTQPFDVARQGITGGLEAVRGRGNTAFDTAVGELGRYQNPYGAGLQTQNPDQLAAMQRMAQANNAMPALQGVAGEGVQADRAMGNVLALLAGTDQARQAANLRATEADRRMMEQNLGIEGNMLNLGVNMAQAKGQTAWDQMLKQAGFDTAMQEAMGNWTRQNQVGDTNVANRNAWNQGLMQTLLSIVGARAPGTTLPTDTGGWYAAA